MTQKIMKKESRQPQLAWLPAPVYKTSFIRRFIVIILLVAGLDKTATAQEKLIVSGSISSQRSGEKILDISKKMNRVTGITLRQEVTAKKTEFGHIST